MSKRSDAVRRHVQERDEAGQRVRDADIREVYLATAVRWRKLAEQQENIDAALRAHVDRYCDTVFAMSAKPPQFRGIGFGILIGLLASTPAIEARPTTSGGLAASPHIRV